MTGFVADDFIGDKRDLMKMLFTRNPVAGTFRIIICLIVAGCSSELTAPDATVTSGSLRLGPEQRLGEIDKNPSTPFLRYRSDGRLYAIWTEDDGSPEAKTTTPVGHRHGTGKMAPSPMREALLAWSADGGKTWSKPRRVNDAVEAVQGEENGPQVAFGPDNRAYAVWSIPGAKGDKTRANIRFAMEDGKSGFTPARTLNEVNDTARFPIIEAAPDGNLFVGWIDRRIDNPLPRQLYMTRLSPSGEQLTKNYKAGEGLCECCRLGISFADGGSTVYLVDRQVNSKQIRNHVLRKSLDGGITFGTPVEISDDGWQVPSCPHSGPSVGQDGRGYLHVTWFTLGREVKDAGVYYSVSKDGGRSFAPRRLVHANSAPEILHTTLAVGEDGRVYFGWDNLDASNKAQIFVRSLAPDGATWGPVQQISRARQNAARPALALAQDRLHVAWTETDGEKSWVVLRTAALER
jgi:hypothetical protein